MENMSRHKKIYIGIGVALVLVAAVFIAIKIQNKFVGKTNEQQTLTQKDPAFGVDLSSVDFGVPTKQGSKVAISADDKKATYEALLSAQKTLISGDAKAIREYFQKKATTPLELAQVTKLSDADLISLAKRSVSLIKVPPPNMLLASTTVWTRDGNTITVQYTDESGQTATKKVVLVDGKWY